MTAVTPESQVEFLGNVQRLLSEGAFVATYKYALLLALADLAVEMGDDSGDALEFDTQTIAEKFIEYYWRQTIPYLPLAGGKGQVLRQNTGKQAAIINQIVEARLELGDSLACYKQSPDWSGLVSKVARTVREMPLWKLQTVGSQQLDFLYENTGSGKTIELRPGVTYCLRKFYSLMGDLVRGAWVRYIRQHNQDLLGTTTDLTAFLFGTERSNLSTYREILFDLQQGSCFYCDKKIQRAASHVDHFIPWSRYPVDLGHNFVLAHATCNSSKADHLAAEPFLAAWMDRNSNHQAVLADEFSAKGLFHDLNKSNQITRWAYQQTEVVGGLTWAAKDGMVPLSSAWRDQF